MAKGSCSSAKSPSIRRTSGKFLISILIEFQPITFPNRKAQTGKG
jgi:hypothetical protein